MRCFNVFLSPRNRVGAGTKCASRTRTSNGTIFTFLVPSRLQRPSRTFCSDAERRIPIVACKENPERGDWKGNSTAPRYVSSFIPGGVKAGLTTHKLGIPGSFARACGIATRSDCGSRRFRPFAAAKSPCASQARSTSSLRVTEDSSPTPATS